MTAATRKFEKLAILGMLALCMASPSAACAQTDDGRAVFSKVPSSDASDPASNDPPPPMPRQRDGTYRKPAPRQTSTPNQTYQVDAGRADQASYQSSDNGSYAPQQFDTHNPAPHGQANSRGSSVLSRKTPASVATQPRDPIVSPEAVYIDGETIPPGSSRPGSRILGGGSVMTTKPQSIQSQPMMGGMPMEGSVGPTMDGGVITEGEPMMGRGPDGFTNPYCNDCNCGRGGFGMGPMIGRGRMSGGGCSDCGSDPCDCYNHERGERGPYGRPWILAPFDWLDDRMRDECTGWWWGEEFTVFAGVHNFKSPVDLGVNSNFGFQEGVNWAFPFWGELSLGGQVGFEVTQSDFQNSTIITDNRNQFFLTAGLFHRAPCCGGWDLGVVFDWLHDDFYQEFDLGQIRGEIGYWFDGCNELGCDFAIGLRNDNTADQFTPIGARTYDVIDQYFFFWRHRLACRGDIRFGGGFTSNSGGLVGADFNVPIAKSWAIEGGFDYLISDRRTDSISNETWNIGINLVWYPGGTARCACLPYRPFLGVADNGSFMVTRHGTLPQ